MKKNITSKLQQVKLLVLDFDGVMTDNRVLVSEDGTESVLCHRGDGLGIEMLMKKGIEVVVISKETNKVAQARCKKLQIKCWSGIDDKYPLFLQEIKKRNIPLEQVCFMGNDINDAACIRAAGVGVVPADSHESVFSIADYITKKKGGRGAVREVADLVLCDREKF